MRQLLRELKRRKVFRVAAVYAATAFVVWQVTVIAFPALGLPGWTVTLVVALTLIGFPIALVLAWALELTPEGVRRTEATAPPRADGPGKGGDRTAEGERSATGGGQPAYGARHLLAVVGGGLLVAGAGYGAYALWGGGGRGPAVITDRSIAVLPFTNMGGEESAQFTQGVHDDLLTRLANLSGLEVISRTSVMRYEDTAMPLPEIARELDVKWVVEGGVQKVGDQIKVNAQLIDPQSDTHAWADQYLRDLTAEGLFAIQSEITLEIARALQARLSPEEERRIDRRPTENLEAYRLYVQGRGFLDRRSETEIRTAVEYFERALEEDSTYAPAWAALAEAVAAHEGYYGRGPSEAVYDRAWEAARQALALSPDLAEAHASAGLIHMYRHEGPAALRAFRRALELEPSLAQAHRWLGTLLDALGQPGALAHFHRAVQVDPLAPEGHADLGGYFMVRGKYEEALRNARRAKAIEPEYVLSSIIEVMALRNLGRLEEARSILRQKRPMWTSDSWETELALLRVAAGDSASARESLDRLAAVGSDLGVGLVHAALGETDSVFRAFQRIESWDMGEAILFRHGYRDVLDPIRIDTRWEELIRELNTAWGLNRDGSLPEET